jgi:16S rRNA processing protein RimM
MKLIPIARLVGVFGLNGELKCATTSVGAGVLGAGREYALDAEGRRLIRCTSVRRHQNRDLILLEGVTTPEAARKFVGGELFVERGEVALGPDEYLDAELTGLRLLDVRGRELGIVAAVEHLPAQDCLVVGPKRNLVPLVSAFIKSIDLEKGEIVVELPAGLLE